MGKPRPVYRVRCDGEPVRIPAHGTVSGHDEVKVPVKDHQRSQAPDEIQVQGVCGQQLAMLALRRVLDLSLGN
jgi:hypothetical protein